MTIALCVKLTCPPCVSAPTSDGSKLFHFSQEPPRLCEANLSCPCLLASDGRRGSSDAIWLPCKKVERVVAPGSSTPPTLQNSRGKVRGVRNGDQKLAQSAVPSTVLASRNNQHEPVLSIVRFQSPNGNKKQRKFRGCVCARIFTHLAHRGNRRCP